jgi:hypothetical protein
LSAGTSDLYGLHGGSGLVFNPQNENPFEGLGHWDRDLQKAAGKW